MLCNIAEMRVIHSGTLLVAVAFEVVGWKICMYRTYNSYARIPRVKFFSSHCWLQPHVLYGARQYI